MTLVIECIIICIIYGTAIVASTVHHKEAWLYEYAPEVQKRFLENNPDYTVKEKTKQPVSVIIMKIIFCLAGAILLAWLVHLAGARDFMTGVLYSYIIWSVVNVFDAIVLDIGVFAHWKKVRLPGTEDMDKEYRSNAWKDIKGGIIGQIIGIPVACICGWIISLIGI